MKVRSTLVAAGLCGAAAALSASCVPTTIRRLSAFSSRFADNDERTIGAAARALPNDPAAGRPTNALGVPLLVGVREGTPRAVVLYDLAANRELWATELAAASAPELHGDLVLVTVGPRVVALDLRTGRERWGFDAATMLLSGAAREGDTLYVVLSLGAQGGGARVGKVLALDAASGRERWSHQVVGILGRPAALGGQVFVPWDRQSIAVLDGATGVERARVRATDDVLSWVFAAPQGVYYGSRGAYRFSPRSAAGTREGSSYLANPIEGVPGDPPLFRDAFLPSTGARTARDKIRFAFAPRVAEGDAVAFEHDAVFLAYYRFLLCVDARTGEVRWARALGPEEGAPAAGAAAGQSAADRARAAQAIFAPYDVQYLQVTARDLLVVDSGGRLLVLDPASGAVRASRSVAANLGALSLDAGGLEAGTEGARPAPEGNAREQIVSLIRDADNRLVPARAYLVRLLGRRPEQEVTRDLLELYRQRSLPASLRQDVATALRERRNGAQFLLAALEGEQSHYNYLENRQAPPLDVIAPTLAAMGAREAVPVLLQHLFDHETPVAHLPLLVEAVTELGDASAIPQLQAFLQRYRADSTFAGEGAATLQAITRAVFRLGDVQARGWLHNFAEDPSVHQPVRDAVAGLFEDERRGGQQQTEEQQLNAAREQVEGRLNELREAVSTYPSTLSNESFDTEWSAHTDELRGCAQGVLARRSDLNEIRITITLRSEPSPSLFLTTPPSASLPTSATFAQRMDAIEAQGRWIAERLEALRAHRSSARTVVYAPQDAEMQRCMDAVLRPLRFPGFGRAIATRQFTQRISTVRTSARPTGTPGFGQAQGSSAVVPWFLVSSPSFDASGGRLLPLPAAPNAGAAAGRTPPVAPGAANADAGVAAAPAADAGVGAPPSLPGTGAPPALPGAQPSGAPPAGAGRPWWEEQ